MKEKIELRDQVDQIIGPLLAVAGRYNCKIENNLPGDAYIFTDTTAFLFILNRLLTLLIQSSYNSCIRISAMREVDTLSIIITDENNDYKAFISGKMEKHQAILKKAGCQLAFEFKNRMNITVILRFANQN